MLAKLKRWRICYQLHKICYWPHKICYWFHKRGSLHDTEPMLSPMTVTQDHYCSINATQNNIILKGLQGMGARMTTIIIMVPTTKMMVVMMMSIWWRECNALSGSMGAPPSKWRFCSETTHMLPATFTICISSSSLDDDNDVTNNIHHLHISSSPDDDDVLVSNYPVASLRSPIDEARISWKISFRWHLKFSTVNFTC